MPRHKIVKLSIENLAEEELQAYKQLVETLQENPQYNEFDFSTIKITISHKRPPERIQNIDKKIENLERYIAINGNSELTKNKLCMALKITFPTLDKWLSAKFISRGNTYKPWKGWEYFDLNKVLVELKAYRDRII